VSVRVDTSLHAGRRALDDYAIANYGMPLEELEKIQAIITGPPQRVIESLSRYIALVQHAGRSTVTDVFVAGRRLKCGGQLVDVNLADIQRSARGGSRSHGTLGRGQQLETRIARLTHPRPNWIDVSLIALAADGRDPRGIRQRLNCRRSAQGPDRLPGIS
jgi:hypothetical protein